MQEIYIKIPGKPIAKQTHRECVKVDWVKRDVRRWPYFPQAKEAAEVKKIIRAQYQGDILDSALFVRFVFHIGVPKSWTKAQKHKALTGTIHHISKPDASNLAKFYEDCMKGIIYTDDSIIVWVSPIKVYDDEAYTEIYITPFRIEEYQRFQGLVA